MESGKQFDPAIVAVFLANINSVVKIREKVNRPRRFHPIGSCGERNRFAGMENR